MTQDIRVEQPRRHEVFQRETGAALVPIRVTGIAGAQARLAVVGPTERIIARRKLAVTDGVASGVIEVPQGGWYDLTLPGGRRGALTRFGVGDVFVVAGQSNAAGHGDGFIADRSGLVSVCTEGGDWALAEKPEGLPGPMQSGSPWPVLGELLALAQRVPIGFINVAVGGTSSEQWLPGGDLYPALKQALVGRRVRAVLWHQGESDAASAVPSERTYQNMATIIAQSRADAGWPVPWYVALASHVPGVAPEQQQAVRAAQTALYRMGLALPGPDTDTYVPESMRYDQLHFAQVGLVVHAILWFRALHFSAA